MSEELVANAFAIAAGVPSTVLQLLVVPTAPGITWQSRILDKLATAVKTVPSEVIRCCFALCSALWFVIGNSWCGLC